MVPKPEHPETTILQIECPLFIVLDITAMLTSINLYDQLYLQTNKVQHVIIKRMLPPKLAS